MNERLTNVWKIKWNAIAHFNISPDSAVSHARWITVFFIHQCSFLKKIFKRILINDKKKLFLWIVPHFRISNCVVTLVRIAQFHLISQPTVLDKHLHYNQATKQKSCPNQQSFLLNESPYQWHKTTWKKTRNHLHPVITLLLD